MNQYKGIPIQKIVANDEWQDLRKSFLGSWKKSPNQNVEKLREYLGDMTDELKLVRVFNYLTGSGFRIGVIGNEASNELKIDVERKLEFLEYHAI